MDKLIHSSRIEEPQHHHKDPDLNLDSGDPDDGRMGAILTTLDEGGKGAFNQVLDFISNRKSSFPRGECKPEFAVWFETKTRLREYS